MNNEVDEVAKTRERVVANNLHAVLAQVDNLRERINQLEALVTTQHEQVNQLQQKYNLLLTKNFHGGSTEP